MISTLRHIIKIRLGHKYKSFMWLPLEIDRYQVDIDEIKSKLERLNQRIQVFHSIIIYNSEECCKRKEAYSGTIIVPIAYIKRTA